MSRMFKIGVVALSLIAGAAATAQAHGTSGVEDFDVETYFEEQSLYGGS